MKVTVVGGGLAGCEASFQLAARGIDVELVEQKPLRRTPAQHSDALCELVCSNSLRGAALSNAVGLLKEELRRAGSLILEAADASRVPAGGALAVDRDRFSAYVEAKIAAHPRITRRAETLERVPEGVSREAPVILATGPLTADALARDLASIVGAEHLAYYDAIAPIVATESLDMSKVFRQSRYGKGEAPEGEGEAQAEGVGGDDAYLNCPFDEAGYKAFVAAIVAAEKVEPRAFEEIRYFEGCLPIEVMASRGELTLAYGPMKPVGLVDPRTGRRPFAVVQLRQEDHAATAYNLVGFQSRMTWTDQGRVLRMIPGLEQAEFLRFGSVHRNTFVNAPRLLTREMEVRARPGLYLAGQITGVEGYVESAAGGLLCGLMLADRLRGRDPVPPPPTTALGGLLHHLGTPREDFQPSNITWACLPPLDEAPREPGKRVKKLPKRERYEALAARALADHDRWRAEIGAPPPPT